MSGEETTGWVSGRKQLRLVCSHLTSTPWLSKMGVPQLSCRSWVIMFVLGLALVGGHKRLAGPRPWGRRGWMNGTGGTVMVVDNIIGCHGNCITIYKCDPL